MTELDAEIGPLALELINEFGKAISYRKDAVSGYDVTTATAISGGVPVDMKGTVEEYNGQSFLSGLIEGGDKKVTVAALSFAETPTPQDTITFDGSTYRIVGVKTIYSGDLAAIHELQCRR